MCSLFLCWPNADGDRDSSSLVPGTRDSNKQVPRHG